MLHTRSMEAFLTAEELAQLLFYQDLRTAASGCTAKHDVNMSIKILGYPFA